MFGKENGLEVGRSIGQGVMFCAVFIFATACDRSKPSEKEEAGNKESASSGSPLIELQEEEVGNPFREIFPREEYDKRVLLAEKHIKTSIRQAAQSNYPAVGEKIAKVSDDLSAKNPALQKDNIFFQRGDYKSWARYLPTRSIMPGPYTAHLFEPENKVLTEELKPGLLHATFIRAYRPDIAYLRNEIGKRGPKWDDHLIFAGLAFPTNSQLAETALYHAVEAGYPEDELTDFFKVIFRTLSKEGPEKEMEKFLSHFEGKEIPWVYIPPLHSALIVTGRIDFMQRIVDVAGDNCVFDAATIDQFLKWTKGKSKWPEGSLLERARENRRRSIANKLTSSQRVQIIESRKRLEDRLSPGPPINSQFSFNSPPGGYSHFEYTSDKMPHNLHQNIIVKLQANGIDRGWPTKFRIDWVSLYTKKRPSPKNFRFYRMNPKQFLRFSIGSNYKNTLLETIGNGMPGSILSHENILDIPFIEKPSLPDTLVEDFSKKISKMAEEPKEMEIDMIRYNNEIGIYVNGVCYLHLPTDPDPDVNIDLNIISLGMKVSIEKQDIWELKN